MTDYWGLSGIGLPGSRPEPDELALLQRVRDGLANLPDDSTEGNEAA